MHRSVLALSLSFVVAVPAYAQDWKSNVDGLIRTFRARQAPTGALGDGTVRGTAKVLTAAAHSHRMYGTTDGPWIRNALKHLIAHRQENGTFRGGNGDDATVTTQWVVEALSIVDPVAFTTELDAARKSLGEKAKALPFEAAVDELRAAVAAGKTLKELVADVATATARGPVLGSDGEFDGAASTDALVRLVAAQVASKPKRTPPEATPAPTGAWSEAQQKGFDYLLRNQKDGVFHVKTPGGEVPTLELTALGLAALQTKPRALRSPEEATTIEKGLTWVLGQQNEDGSFGFTTLNYVTSAAIAAFTADADRPAEAKAKIEPSLQRAQQYLLGIQHTEDRGFTRSDRDYGSIGYGSSERGDLSNLQFALEGLHRTGLPKGHEAYTAAISFLQRTQNLREVNDFKARTRNPDEGGEWQTLTSGDDGGAAYYPGNSPFGYVELADGSKYPRSYGSMTYALLKAYTLCGVKPDDVRIKAAIDWIGRNWTLDENPGAAPNAPKAERYQGLYYAYMVMAQALDIAGIDKLTTQTESGAKVEVDWRADLRKHLTSVQAADGSWVNDRNGRWWEDRALLCTIYALLALDRTDR